MVRPQVFPKKSGEGKKKKFRNGGWVSSSGEKVIAKGKGVRVRSVQKGKEFEKKRDIVWNRSAEIEMLLSKAGTGG